MIDLRRYTMARVALGRTGNAVPMAETLRFRLAHARARDAVHFPLDARALAEEVGGVALRSAARDRGEYLRRPDLGRKLSEESRARLEHGVWDVALVLADGLSALAVHRHAPDLVRALQARLADLRFAPITVVEQGRVAIGDEIGSALGAAVSVVLIGERPGLSSPDSLGAYITWGPRPGRTDAERNCVSNIRAEGLPVDAAADLIALIVCEARARRLTGVNLKPGGDYLPVSERISATSLGS